MKKQSLKAKSPIKSTKLNLQSADNPIPDDFYELTLPYIKNNDRLLNLGCGVLFNFERIIYDNRHIKPLSVDIIDIDKIGVQKPEYVDRFLVKSVEEKFHLEEKYDVITFFEIIEHVDKTDVLIKNCYDNLKDDGLLIFSFPNLASIYSRIELMLGLQPHILEVSNEYPNFGTGIFGRLNNQKGLPLHHIRGITSKAMKELVNFHGFKVVKIFGYSRWLNKLFYFVPGLAPVNFFVCRKNK